MIDNVEMYFDIQTTDHGTQTLIPVVMVGEYKLRLNKMFYNMNDADAFFNRFMVGLMIENENNFLDMYQRKQDEALAAADTEQKEDTDAGTAA